MGGHGPCGEKIEEGEKSCLEPMWWRRKIRKKKLIKMNGVANLEGKEKHGEHEVIFLVG